VALNAQRHAAAFYARFGFAIAGQEFMEAGIPHVAMEREL
jgi:predicted GNAT family N-acyltransferase